MHPCLQVEFESAKLEIRRLREDLEIASEQLEEIASLKKIAEKQEEEALQALQAEREAKYALKKELDQRINNESMYNLSNLAYSIRGKKLYCTYSLLLMYFWNFNLLTFHTVLSHLRKCS